MSVDVILYKAYSYLNRKSLNHPSHKNVHQNVHLCPFNKIPLLIKYRLMLEVIYKLFVIFTNHIKQLPRI